MFNWLSRLRFVLFVAPLVVQAPLPGFAQADGRAPRGFAWEATRGGERVLLVGALHVGRADAAAAVGADGAALREAQVVAFEANVFDAQASLAAMQRWAMYPDGAPGLDAYVDAAMLARLDRIAARGGGGLSLCCRMKPWMVANTLALMEAGRAGLSPAYGTEARLYELALATGKPIVEIESADQQLRLFDEAALSVQLDYLRHTVETLEDGTARGEIGRLAEAWSRGDEAAMERLVAELARDESAAQRFVVERVLRGRHPRMLAAIERYAASGRLHLAVIGALHYFGPDGLLQQLRSRGYTVKRLP